MPELPDGRLPRTGEPAIAGLARADDQGVNRVENDSEQHPENGREEKTAHDLGYGMGLEEGG